TETPYPRVGAETQKVTKEIDYFTAAAGGHYVVAQARAPLDPEGHLRKDAVIARFPGGNRIAPTVPVDYLDVSPTRVVSGAPACVPFLEEDDTSRELMGANMQRQAVPRLEPEEPIVGTGMEYVTGKDSGAAILCRHDGIVEKVEAKEVIVRNVAMVDGKQVTGDIERYQLSKYIRSNQGTCYNQRPIVKEGDHVTKGEVLADGPSMEKGELALGRNVLTAFMTWEGYNYEDAIIMSES